MNALLSAMLHWWNLLFIIPIALAGLLLLMSAVTGLGDGNVEAEAIAGDTEADVEAEGEADTDSPLEETLRTFGVGVVPVSLLVQAFLLFFGIWGLTVNRLLNIEEGGGVRVWISLIAALIAGAVTTAVFGSGMRRFFPDEEAATGGKDLIARSGRVVYTVSEQGGTVQVRDAGGTIHQVAARIARGADPIAGGCAVLIVAQDKEAGHFIVEESPFAEETVR